MKPDTNYPKPLRLLGMTSADLAHELKHRYGKGPFLAKALYRRFFKQLQPQAWKASAILASPGLADRLAGDMVFCPGRIVSEIESEGVVKMVVALNDGHHIEAVVIPMRTHHTICISSQVGCRQGCRFCETGTKGLLRHLTAAEMVGQVYLARQKFGEKLRNVVFMGMGEPFDNFEAVMQTVDVLNDQHGFDIAHRYITVSTAGHIEGIRRLAAANRPYLKLAVSLNAPNDSLRTRLMPINRRASLKELQKALQQYPLKKDNLIMIAYVLIPDVNDSPACVTQLAAWLAPLRAKVNLIPFNPGTTDTYRAPSEAELDHFREQLIALKVNVQKRWPRGRQMMAACGQLGSCC